MSDDLYEQIIKDLESLIPGLEQRNIKKTLSVIENILIPRYKILKLREDEKKCQKRIKYCRK